MSASTVYDAQKVKTNDASADRVVTIRVSGPAVWTKASDPTIKSLISRLRRVRKVIVLQES